MAGPSIPKPTAPGTTAGQSGGSAADGSWTWSPSISNAMGGAGDWVWRSSAGGDQSQQIDATGNGTPSFAQIGSGSAAGPFAGAPGASLDTSGADAERARIQAQLDQLQQQAATGNGAWQQTLQQSIQNAQSNASALGQSEQAQAKGGYGSQLRNFGNAQAQAAQMGVGEWNILRAETQQSAQDQLAALLGTQGTQDVTQSANAAAALQAKREADAAKSNNDATQAGNVAQGVGQGIAAVAQASHGGRVPGQPFVMGDDSRNDTVPALLSPKEIVVPISAARDPDKAADFARAVAERGLQKRAGGGNAWQPGMPDPTVGTGNILPGAEQEHPSVNNGAILDTSQYDANRTQVNSLADALAARGAGNGPSVAPQMLTNASDSTIEGTMKAQQNQRAVGELARAVSAQQQAGAAAAGAHQKEASQATALEGETTESQRARDMAMEKAQQQALWNNSLLNAGVGLQQQQALMGIAGAAGQGALALSSAGGSNQSATPTASQAAGDAAFNAPVQSTESAPGDFPQGGDGPQTAAFGGLIGPMEDDERTRMHRFLRHIERKAA